jgi:hypothetical protein
LKLQLKLSDPSGKGRLAFRGCEIALRSVVLGRFGLQTFVLGTHVDQPGVFVGLSRKSLVSLARRLAHT